MGGGGLGFRISDERSTLLIRLVPLESSESFVENARQPVSLPCFSCLFSVSETTKVSVDHYSCAFSLNKHM